MKSATKAGVHVGKVTLPRRAGSRWGSVQLLGAAVIAFSLMAIPVIANAGQADVLAVEASQGADKSWRFSVTVKHDDAGWDHYADKWAVFAPDGTMLGERVLAHPHDNEQPVTRSQSGIIIDETINVVTIKAHDKVHGWGSEAFTYELKR